MPPIHFSIVIPVYGSGRSLPELAGRLHAVLRDMKETYEIILVDDGSPGEDTWSVVRSLAMESRNVRAFRLARNFGQAGALLCGMAQARGEWIVTMDDDLQHLPEAIPALAEQREHDVVIARFPRKRCGLFKKLASNLKKTFDVHLLGKPRSITASSFRIIKKRVAQSLLGIRTPRPFFIAMILTVTSDLVNVDVDHAARRYGRSNYSLGRSFSLLSNLIFNNSAFLLRAMSVSGFVIMGISLIAGVGLIVRRLFQDRPVVGWTSLMVVLLMATGIIVFCLGILGEYIARLIATAESRPTWVIKESTHAEKTRNEP